MTWTKTPSIAPGTELGVVDAEEVPEVDPVAEPAVDIDSDPTAAGDSGKGEPEDDRSGLDVAEVARGSEEDPIGIGDDIDVDDDAGKDAGSTGEDVGDALSRLEAFA